ncbi:MAG: SDR family NAD(P)-dependent oxidoreductase, partial [Alphaproteobacteria bacterium]|nr:SDR family NAD(P)-dependent oxidoreductase [Alphaproteobacteria bacterium]
MPEQQRCAIVTGASGGIGSAVARRLAASEIAVVVNYAGDAAAAEKLVGEIETAAGKAIAFKTDISRADDVAAMFDA